MGQGGSYNKTSRYRRRIVGRRVKEVMIGLEDRGQILTRWRCMSTNMERSDNYSDYSNIIVIIIVIIILLLLLLYPVYIPVRQENWQEA